MPLLIIKIKFMTKITNSKRICIKCGKRVRIDTIICKECIKYELDKFDMETKYIIKKSRDDFASNQK
jgi:hypothetical protein